MQEDTRSAFLNKIGTITKESTDVIYSEKVIPTESDEPRRFTSSTKKVVNTDTDFVPHAKRKSKQLQKDSVMTYYVDPLGMEKNGVALDVTSLTTKKSTDVSPIDRNKRVIKELTANRDITAKPISMPPIIRYGAPDEIPRVPTIDLMMMYAKDGMVNTWINRLVEYFLSAQPKIKSKNSADQIKLDEWSTKTKFRNLIKSRFQHVYITGNAVWRWVPDENGELKYLDYINPMFFDAYRDESGRVVYTDKGVPLAYVQYIRSDEDISKYPSDRLITQSQMFDYQSGIGVLFYPDELIPFVFNTLGDDWWGIGQVEADYVDLLNKKNGDQGAAEAIQSSGYPKIVGYQGDKEHPPTPAKMEDLMDAIDDLKVDQQVAVPFYDKVDVIEAKMSNIDTVLKYLTDNAVTGLGGPKALVTGTGSDTNRSTLADQKTWLERSLKMEQQDLTEELQNTLMPLLKVKLNLKDEPYLEWQEVDLESIDGRTSRLIELGKAGLLNPSDPKMISYVADLMDIPITKFEKKVEVVEEEPLKKEDNINTKEITNKSESKKDSTDKSKVKEK
ncbi:MAG: hypothetical protein WC307_06750 [Candidatus Nanoarchaeia archaeon]|jgi:hypothetical protein